MPALFGWIIAKVLSDNVLRFVATKALMVTFFIVVLPIILNNFVYDIMNTTFTWMQSHSDTTSINPSLTYDGLLGWFVTIFRIPECLSVIISALTMRLAIRHIPFLRI